MIIKTAEKMHDLIKSVLLKAGADDHNASLVAEHLVRADLSGVDSHGVWHLQNYVERIQKGELLPAARPEVIKETPASVFVTGNWTFGQVAARFAMQKVIAKGRLHEVAVAGLVCSNHIGRLGHYAEMAAENGMISLICLGGQGAKEGTAVPHGGRETILHTNPIAMAFPGRNGGKPAMMFDFATTTVAGVKIVNAQRRNEMMRPGCLVDREGRPSTDPNDYFMGGGHLPFGEHKGYGFMMAVEYLGRILCGSEGFGQPHLGFKYDRHAGTFILVMKSDLFQTYNDYVGLAEDFASRIRASAPAPDFEEVQVPGDMEIRTRAVRQRDGIPIADDVWQTVVQAAELVGMTNL